MSLWVLRRWPRDGQFGAQGLVIVDFAVEDDLNGTVLVAERLAAAAEVDDRQTAMDQSQARIGPIADAVGTAVGDGIAHGLEHRGIDGPIRIRIQHASDAAHDRGSLQSWQGIHEMILHHNGSLRKLQKYSSRSA